MGMRLMHTFILSAAIALLCIAGVSASYAATVTVDVAAKTATGDSATVEPSKPRIAGNQVGVLVKSTVTQPQSVTIKFAGIKDEDYDVYVNGAYKGPKPGKELQSGVQYRIEGSVADPALVRCLAALKDPINNEYRKLQTASSSEAKRVCATLSQATGWVASGLGREQAWRSVAVVIAPAGRALSSMTLPRRDDEYGTARAITTACWLLQQARDRMYHVITDPVLRNNAVVSMTPVGLAATYTVKNGKPHIDAKLTNDCNLPVSGAISFALPSGWKSNAKKLKFAQLKSGQVFRASFDLIAPPKATAPDSVPVAANLTVTQDTFTAGLKLKVVAIKQATVH